MIRRQKLTRSFRLGCFAASCALISVLSGCATTPRAYVEPAPISAEERRALNLRVHDAVWQLVNDKHFDPNFRGVDWTTMRTKYRVEAGAATDDAELYRVLAQLCRELRESHLVPLPPRRAFERKSAHRMAVGMIWVTLEGRPVITEVIAGGPAANAGVLPGWVVVACEGRPLADGPPRSPKPGQPVTYTFLDLNNQQRTITFEPKLLPVVATEASSALPGGYQYLRFGTFDRATLLWLNSELKEHLAAPGIIIDLRRNPGGSVFAANLAIAQFFDHTVATGTFVRRSGRSSEGHGWPFFSAKYAGRVAVLTSPATGSAAEIFAHVLQHEKRALIVGRRTAGAVVISRTYPLPDGGTLQVPIEDYLGRDNQRLEGRGVTPDIGVSAPALTELRAGRDKDIEAALEALKRDGVAQVTSHK